MQIPEFYAYLATARRDLRVALEAVPEPVLAQPQLSGDRFHCIKDLLFHVAAVEDGWLQEDVRRQPPVLDTMPTLAAVDPDAGYGAVPLSELFAYWSAVERTTRAYLADLPDGEASRVVTVHDAPDERYTAGGLLWHVMLHEVRHTAQICMLLRLQGIKPPALDLLWYLPRQ
jgi:uncharacterized damage-inducible protein DinB